SCEPIAANGVIPSPRLTQFVRSGQAPTARTSHHLIDHPKYVWITLAFYVRSFASLRTTLQLNPRAFASLAGGPCNILRHRVRRENPSSDPSTRWRRRLHSDATRRLRCATALQNVFDVLKLHG